MTRHAIAEQTATVKGQQRDLKTLPCPVCGAIFTQTRWWQKHCSIRCTDRAYKARVIERLREEIREEIRVSKGRNGS